MSAIKNLRIANSQGGQWKRNKGDADNIGSGNLSGQQVLNTGSPEGFMRFLWLLDELFSNSQKSTNETIKTIQHEGSINGRRIG